MGLIAGDRTQLARRAIMPPVSPPVSPPASLTLQGSLQPLAEVYDVALLDLDGVVYLGPQAVRGAPEALAKAREHGMRLAFVTNNAARPPSAVAHHLNELGIAARPAEIVTSAQAAARYLAEHLPGGARVLVVGTLGLEQALREQGLTPVADAHDHVDAVVQGYSPELNWRMLAEGAVAINRGVPWVATNLDPTVPSPRGPLPGNGSLVAALRHATRREPVVTGKPDPAMHRESLLRSGAEQPIVVGDRLDTDIEGANAVGCASLLVLSGVTSAADLLVAAPALRPNYLAADVGGLLDAHSEPVPESGGATCGAWHVERVNRPGSDAAELRLVLRRRTTADAGASSGAPDAEVVDDLVTPDDLDALRAACTAAWSGSDVDQAAGTRRHGAGATVRIEPQMTDDGVDAVAAAVLARLGLGS